MFYKLIYIVIYITALVIKYFKYYPFFLINYFIYIIYIMLQ